MELAPACARPRRSGAAECWEHLIIYDVTTFPWPHFCQERSDLRRNVWVAILHGTLMQSSVPRRVRRPPSYCSGEKAPEYGECTRHTVLGIHCQFSLGKTEFLRHS